MKQIVTKKWFEKLTPEMAWEQYVGTSVELFLSNFREDGYAKDEIDKMCIKYASELPGLFSQIFTVEQVEHIAALFLQYIDTYIDKKGGYDKLELYTLEELDAIADADIQFILSALKKL
mgnify:CR=1 FL=1